jgi:hypothetical protein
VSEPDDISEAASESHRGRPSRWSSEPLVKLAAVYGAARASRRQQENIMWMHQTLNVLAGKPANLPVDGPSPGLRVTNRLSSALLEAMSTKNIDT